jgi:SPASM domain peptide maturase of grasp-with-spasm system
MNEHTPFKLFTNCKLVRGAGRSTICDLERNIVHLIPHSLHDLLLKFEGKTISEVKDGFNHEYDEVIEEYFKFLDDKDLIIFDEELSLFPEIDLKWQSPSKIIYCILDFDQNKHYETSDLAIQLTELGCQYLEIRSYSPLNIEEYIAIIQPFRSSTITSINLLLPYDEKVTEMEWHDTFRQFDFVTGLTLHGCPASLVEEMGENISSYMSYRSKQLENEKCCGVIKEEYFVSYIETFTESLHFNSCLNRKISIDRKGDIKNCPSMVSNFGNITTTSLIQAVELFEFKRMWGITKDQIETCRDCEFRYVCTDCRAYIEQPENELSKPLKCGYNPHTCEWEEWSLNPLKQKAILTYQLQ